MTKIYLYDDITKEYIGSRNADLDPEETKRQGKNVPLVPAYATLIKPPAKEDLKTRVFNLNNWEIVDDFRGLYMVNSDMQPQKVVDFGSLPEGYAVATEEQAQKILEDDLFYIVQDGALIPNPNYEEQKAQREAERVGNLQCTKRVFVLMLEQLGLDYFEQIKPLIQANRQAELEWDLCVELQRKNPLLNVMGAQLGVTPEQIDNLFKYANDEITQEEFLNVN
jgi:hypothetical protein